MPQGGKCFMNGPINTLIDKNKFILNNLIRLSVQISQTSELSQEKECISYQFIMFYVVLN